MIVDYFLYCVIVGGYLLKGFQYLVILISFL